jgi:hypothetical protein
MNGTKIISKNLETDITWEQLNSKCKLWKLRMKIMLFAGYPLPVSSWTPLGNYTMTGYKLDDHIQIASGDHPAHPVGTGGFSSCSKAAGDQIWPHTSI